MQMNVPESYAAIAAPVYWAGPVTERPNVGILASIIDLNFARPTLRSIDRAYRRFHDNGFTTEVIPDGEPIGPVPDDCLLKIVEDNRLTSPEGRRSSQYQDVEAFNDTAHEIATQPLYTGRSARAWLEDAATDDPMYLWRRAFYLAHAVSDSRLCGKHSSQLDQTLSTHPINALLLSADTQVGVTYPIRSRRYNGLGRIISATLIKPAD